MKASTRLTCFGFLFLFFGWRSGLMAQTETLSLSRCLALAAQNSFRLQAGEAEVQAAGGAYRVELARYLPQVAAGLAHNQLFYQQYNYRQQVGQALLDWSAGDWLLKTADIQKKNLLAQQANREQTYLEITHRVAQLYVSILQKQVNREVLQNRFNLLNEHLQISQALWQAGTRTQLDILQTQSAINQLQEEMLAAELEADNLRQELAKRLNLPDYRSFRLREFPERFFQMDSLSNLALQQNPLLTSLRFQYEAQQLRLREVQAARLPHVQLTGGYFLDRDPTANGNSWQVGAGLQFPLLRWGLGKSQQQEIRAVARALQLQQAEISRELQIKLDQLSERTKKLWKIYQVEETRFETNRQLLQLATANYQAGLITNLEYLTAQKELAENELTKQETRLDYLLNLIEIYTLTNQTAKIAQLQGE
ncbi:TolC family protein [candidate division KSB1 bacterium]|nr:MAG: TolC family protein [candidate division KSB1 bacterium]MBC6948740.1 TolC family protein [candidate division KSB1 bacterium]MCE7940581.1 TolC family protein [Chlorobi bacterium CHB1]MDL1875065.1 TolC family protein [Cytophagia bacterium CHB2]